MYDMKKKGFTLIELLVVIAIIGLLATLSVVALNSARMKARDVRRKADLKQIYNALQMYYDENGKEIILNPGKTWVEIVENSRASQNVIYHTAEEFQK